MTQLQLTSYSPRRGSAAAAGNSAESTRDTPLPSIEPSESQLVFSGCDSSASRAEFRFRTPSFSLSISSPDDREPATPNFTWSPSSNGVGQPAGTAVGNIAFNLDRLQIADQTPPRFSHSASNSRSTSQGRMSEEPEMALTSQALVRGSRLSGASTPGRGRSGSRNVEPGYEVHEEDAPEDAFNAAGFQSALAETKCLVQELESALRSSSLHLERSSAMHKLHAKAVRLESFQLASTRKLGFVGDAGAGKSSLINSLLDIQGLIRTSSGGAACTFVATEFHFHELPTFHIEVELLGEVELLDQLVQLLQSYRQFHFKEFDTSFEAERSDVEKRAGLATDTFNSMFLGRVPSQQFLLRQPEDEVRRRFQDLVQDMRPSSASMNKFGLSRETCAQELRLLSSPVESSDERFAWPFIRRIKVSLNAHILSKGLVLVDLPGLRDLNSARRNITERYLRECDDIFAVCKIDRATSDTSIQDVLNKARQLPHANIGIICTRSDDIASDEALHDWQGARGQHVKAMQDNIDDDNAELKELKDLEKELEDDSDDKYEPTSEERKELRDIRRRIRQVRVQLETNKFRLQSFLIHSRNEHVSDKLEENYAQCVPEGELNVFCVSNHIYKEKRDLPKSEAQRHLQLSGIPALRRFCISVVSESQYRVASQFITVKVPAVIEAVALWLQSGSDTVDAERKLAIIHTLDEMESRLSSSLLQRTSPVHKLSAQLRRHFQTQICDRQHVPSWSAAAQAAGEIWGTWAHGTYSAFCRQYGNYSTQAKSWHDWNGEAMETMVQQMAAPWQGLELWMQFQQRAIAHFIDSPTDSATDFLEDELGSNLVALNPLRHALMTEQRSLTYRVEDVFAEADTQLRTLHTDGLSSLRTSFFGAAMESSYMACNRESGRGSHARRVAIMDRTLSRESLFTDILDKMRDRFASLADSLQDDLADAVNSYLASIHDTLDLVRNENTALESQRDLEFHGRVSAIVQKAKRDLQRIHERINEQTND